MRIPLARARLLGFWEIDGRQRRKGLSWPMHQHSGATWLSICDREVPKSSSIRSTNRYRRTSNYTASSSWRSWTELNPGTLAWVMRRRIHLCSAIIRAGTNSAAIPILDQARAWRHRVFMMQSTQREEPDFQRGASGRAQERDDQPQDVPDYSDDRSHQLQHAIIMPEFSRRLRSLDIEAAAARIIADHRESPEILHVRVEAARSSNIAAPERLTGTVFGEQEAIRHAT
jgi:hypothetical protein